MLFACRLWSDQNGAIVSSELVLIATILVLGMIVGLAALRDSVVQELGDIAGALGNLNQSYNFGGVTSCCASVAGSRFTDALDNCDIDQSGVGGNAVATCEPAVNEGD
jgi:Flp pilus assembly pilin Flp